jgi:hypothetical protein
MHSVVRMDRNGRYSHDAASKFDRGKAQKLGMFVLFDELRIGMICSESLL